MQKTWLKPYLNTQQKTVTIIGAGINGAYTAYYLAQHGYKVYIIDKNAAIADGASGNPQAILYYSSSGRDHLLDEMFDIGYIHTSKLVKQLLIEDAEYKHCGSIHIANNPRLQKQQQNIINKQLNNFSLIQNKYNEINNNYQDYLFDRDSMWIKPKALVTKLLNHPNIKRILNACVQKLVYIDNQWQIYYDQHTYLSTGNVVLCTGYELANFEQVKDIPITPNSGQISLIPKFNNIDKILCFGGYLTPALDGYHCLGATYHPNEIITKPNTLNHELNIKELNSIMSVPLEFDLKSISGRVSTRGTTKDYFPIIGPATTYSLFKVSYHPLGYNPKLNLKIDCPYLPGLYLNLGHGSKGMLSGSFAGKLITQYITNQDAICSNQLREKVHPHRFWLKRLVYETNNPNSN